MIAGLARAGRGALTGVEIVVVAVAEGTAWVAVGVPVVRVVAADIAIGVDAPRPDEPHPRQATSPMPRQVAVTIAVIVRALRAVAEAARAMRLESTPPMVPTASRRRSRARCG